MQNKYLMIVVVFLVLVISSSVFASDPGVFANRIEGTVYDHNRRPLPEVNIELQDAVGSLISHAVTGYSGRFVFTGLSSGRFRIKVLPFKAGLMEQIQDVEIVPPSVRINSVGSDVAYVEFYLQAPKRPTSILQEAPPEVVFVQNIPEVAQKLFKNGISNLEKSSDEGLKQLEEALKIFPDYFDALSGLGKEYVLRKDYKKAYPYLIKAIDINPRSFSTYYNLGFAFTQLDEIPAALQAVKACLFLNGDSYNAQFLYGTLLRMNKNYEDSEKSLLKAKSLGKGKNAEVHWQLALLYNKLNRNQDAIVELETFLKIEPNSPDKNKIKDLIAKLKSTAANK